MRLQRLVYGVLAGGMMLIWACLTHGQQFPTKPIRIVTAEPGGTTDFAARLFAQELSARLGQQVIVENRATGIIAAEIVSKAAPDGYTLLLQGNILWLGPLLQKMPYAIKDFAPVSLTNTAANILVLHPSVPVSSVKELIAMAKAKPGELNYGSGATGASNHLAAELFKSMAGVNIVRVTYKGSGPIITALLGGEIQLTFGTAASVQPHIKSGKLRAIAVTSSRPSELAPGLPPIAATMPGYESVALYGSVAPARTPVAIVKRLSFEIAGVINKPDVKEKFLNTGVETLGSSPEVFAATIQSDVARVGKVIREAGIRVE
jgi:tripartite-type tricarboxylate transporter receptor subunit TctC